MSSYVWNTAVDNFIDTAKELRTLISRDDHWCLEDCHKCKIRDKFDDQLQKVERLRNFKQGTV